MSGPEATPSDAIAIVGVAGRFPGANEPGAYWRNLCAGRDCLSRFTDDELRRGGFTDAQLADPALVRAGGTIEDYEKFDAEFFGFTPRVAEVLDPQHRIFFECAWEALENAAVDPARFDGAIGVFAGTGLSTYLLYNLATNPRLLEDVGLYQVCIANDKDALTQQLAYKLDLRGPAITLQTACSTSLVAVQQACLNLLNFQCDLALAGGVSIKVPHRQGYLFQSGGISSPDGFCRPFDARAQGTVPGSGCGVVALKRLEDAAGDDVIAVIRGSAVNNDGSGKVGFTAPALEGQAQVIALAQAAAGVTPETIGFIEAHGTATPLGDPIEIAALTRVFRAQTARRAFCALGSAKSNLGHLDAAAGVAGLIKAALAVRAGKIPPTLHFESPNPKAALPESPFFVNTSLIDWPKLPGPRRAGVSSFGIGGTNAHVVLEEAPPRAASVAPTEPQWLLVSARSPAALDAARRRLADHLGTHPELNLADVAHTLRFGRRAFAHRFAAAAATGAEAATALRRGTGQNIAVPLPVRQWLEGREMLGEAKAGQAIPLPTYPFERKRYWIEPPVA
jgi:phthiocerol/phenolphthiocerol synthesis type-I polyketide synthase E